MLVLLAILLLTLYSFINNNIKQKVQSTTNGRHLKQETTRIHDANSILYNCIVCMDRQRTIRFEPCGHMAICSQKK